MNILVLFEYSQAVASRFRALGANAYSCDILPTEGDPQFHFQCDATEALSKLPWNCVIAFPPCTHLCSSGARWWPEKVLDGRQAEGIRLFNITKNLDMPYAIENPVGIMSRLWRKPDQIIQPWMFGHGETKATCLWLNHLPKLLPTDIVSGRQARIHRMSPGPNRAKERSRTYPGIADAMATQWYNHLKEYK